MLPDLTINEQESAEGGKVKCQHPVRDAAVEWESEGRHGFHELTEWSIEIAELTRVQEFASEAFQCVDLAIKCYKINKLAITTNTYYEGKLIHLRPERLNIRLLFEGRLKLSCTQESLAII